MQDPALTLPRGAGLSAVQLARRRILRGSMLNFVAVAFNQGSTLLANVVVARALQKHAFGEYATIQSTLLTATTLSQFAIGAAAAKHIAEFRSADPERVPRVLSVCAGLSIAMAVVGAAFLLIFAPVLAERVLNAPQLAGALRIGAAFVFFSTINGFQTGALSGFEAYGGLARAGIISGVVAVIAISVGSFVGGLTGALCGLSVGALIRTGVYRAFLWKVTPNSRVGFASLREFVAERAILLRFMLPGAIAQSYSPPMIWIANSLLVRQIGGYEEMALFSVGLSIRSLILFIPAVMNNVGLSVLNNEKGKGGTGHYFRVFRENVMTILAVCLAGALLLSICTPMILGVFGKDFEGGKTIVWILLIAGIFEATTVGLYQYIVSNSHIWTQFLTIVLPREGLLVLLAYLLIPMHHALGLACAYATSTGVGMVLHALLVRHLSRRERAKVARGLSVGDSPGA